MRVLHLINRPQVRGAEQFAARLAANLESENVQNAICSLYPANSVDTTDEQFVVGDLPMYRLDVKSTIFDRVVRVEPKAVTRLRRVLNEFKPDLVVGHGTDTLKYASLAKTMRRSVCTAYMNIGLASFWAKSRSRVWFNRFWLRNIDCAISVSELGQKDFIEHYGFNESKSVYIPNAVQVDDFDAAASDPAVRQKMRAELGAADTDVLIGMVGSLSNEKGQDTLIRATSQLIARGLPVHLVLIGQGPDRETLEKQAQEAGIASSVRFLGLRKDIPQVLSGMDVFALASKSEGMPGVLIEAGLAGLPSVSYDVGGVTEVVDHNSTGLVVPTENFDGLVAALEELVNRPEWRTEMGERARTWCRSRFNLDIVTNQYISLFNQLLSGAQLNISGAAAVNTDN